MRGVTSTEIHFWPIMSDPVTGDPIVNCPDPMHLTKNGVLILVFKAQEKYLVQEVSDAYWTHERLLDRHGREYEPASVNETDYVSLHQG